MTTNEAIIDRLIDREGGFVDDPLDAGGTTNMGITGRTLLRYLRRTGAHVPKPGADLRAMIKDLERPLVRDIYRLLYLERWRIDRIKDDELREHLLDCVVLYGPKAVRWAQRFIGVKADAIIGPITLRAVIRSGSATVSRELVKARLMYSARRVKRKPDQAKFLPGWTARALKFLA
jgi:lysozyme family protein